MATRSSRQGPSEVQVKTRLNQHEADLLALVAKRNDRSLSAELRMAVRAYLMREEAAA